MRRLIVNPGTDSAWEIPLRSGVITLGRAEGNDIVLDHPSIADLHCEIQAMASGVTVKNLGSTGTFIDGKPVTESLLLPGQALQLGEIQLRLDDTAPVPGPVRVATPVAAPAAAPAAAPNARCKFHPHNATRFFCPKCHGSFCEVCVHTRAVGGVSKAICRACAVECEPVEIQEEEPVQIPFVSQIAGAFKYPFKGDGLILICVGTMLFLLVDAARWISSYAILIGGIAVILLTIFGTGYLMAFLRRIITSTAAGEEEMPDWPAIEDYGSDVFVPFMQFIGTVVFCFAPTIGLTIYALVNGSDSDSSWLGWATTASMIVGCVYFPMAFTAVAMGDSIIAVNPLVVVPSIIRVLRQYLLTVVVLAVILAVRWLLKQFLVTVIPVPLVPTIITSLIGLYLLVVEMRILGLLYRNNKDELGWF